MSLPETRFVVPFGVLKVSWELLAEVGAKGFECAVLWIGYREGSDVVRVETAYRPHQRAVRFEDGVSVEVTADGLSDLISTLADGQFVPVRLHTHPGEAYHSDVDDLNMIISHPGAISIVVPCFAQVDRDLRLCSVNELENEIWRELEVDEVTRRFVIE